MGKTKGHLNKEKLARELSREKARMNKYENQELTLRSGASDERKKKAPQPFRRNRSE